LPLHRLTPSLRLAKHLGRRVDELFFLQKERNRELPTRPAHRDERTLVIENASYRLAFLFLSYGLLVLAAYRRYVHQERPWDLLLLVVLGGGLATAYQGFHRVLSKRWATISLVAAILAAGFAAVLIWLRA
jgi:hypothetical protein